MVPPVRRLTHQRMPEKSEIVPSIILCKMHPAIGKVLSHMTLMKCPDMSRYGGMPLTQISLCCRLNPGLLH